jgi:hypothetical protein
VFSITLSLNLHKGGEIFHAKGKGHKIKKFTHITDIFCIEQFSHLDHLVPIQNKLVVTEDIRKICLEIKQSKFDSAKELMRIHGFFARINNQEVAWKPEFSAPTKAHRRMIALAGGLGFAF